MAPSAWERRTGSFLRTATGSALDPWNVRHRVLAPAVKLANERLEAVGATPLPDALSPHKLRHTFASLLVALGTDPGAVMDQLGHEDAGFTLRVYRHGMRRNGESKAKLQALVEGTDPTLAPSRQKMPTPDLAERSSPA